MAPVTNAAPSWPAIRRTTAGMFDVNGAHFYTLHARGANVYAQSQRARLDMRTSESQEHYSTMLPEGAIIGIILGIFIFLSAIFLTACVVIERHNKKIEMEVERQRREKEVAMLQARLMGLEHSGSVSNEPGSRIGFYEPLFGKGLVFDTCRPQDSKVIAIGEPMPDMALWEKKLNEKRLSEASL